jgi:xylan 1,4-beta-xylosidase
MPENMKKEEIEYLKGVSRPSLTIEEVKIRDIFEFKVSVPIHGVEMMIIDKLL